MEPEEYALMYRVETSHWWYRGMEKITRALLDPLFPPERQPRILDAGCGTGSAMTAYLPAYGPVTGIDVSEIALKFCRSRGAARLARASVMALPFSEDSFDLVTSFDVLYEQAVPDDLTALGELRRVLANGGYLLLRLPAYDWLRGSHDRAVHTARRYTTGRVRQLLLDSGFEIEYLSYANTLLFPLALVKRFTERLAPNMSGGSDLALEAGRLAPLLEGALALEARFMPRFSLPYGLSVVGLGRKT